VLKNSFDPDSGSRFDIKNAHSGAFRARSETISRHNTDLFQQPEVFSEGPGLAFLQH
jgi:hypothetical protein